MSCCAENTHHLLQPSNHCMSACLTYLTITSVSSFVIVALIFNKNEIMQKVEDIIQAWQSWVGGVPFSYIEHAVLLTRRVTA